MSEPTTEAGRRLYDWLPLHVGPDFTDSDEAIAAIEAEARADLAKRIDVERIGRVIHDAAFRSSHDLSDCACVEIARVVLAALDAGDRGR